MSCEGATWVDARDEHADALQTGARYQVEYDVGKMVGGIGVAVAEPDPTFFALSSRPDITVEDVDVLEGGSVVATIVPVRGGVAEDLLPGILQVPQVGWGDVLLNLNRVRYCGALDQDQTVAAKQKEEARREKIESGAGGGPFNALQKFLNDFRAVAIAGGAVAAGLLLLIVLFMAGRIRQDLTS